MLASWLDSQDRRLIETAKRELEALLTRSSRGILDIKDVQDANQQHGSDFATTLLYAWLLSSKDQGPFIADFFENRHRQLEKASLSDYSLPEKVVLVPGAFYEEYPATGGGGELVMHELEKLGVPVVRVPIRSVGTLEQNSRILRDYLTEMGNKTTLMVSLSKGAADIKCALRDDPECFQHVSLWVSIGGILSGTPLINWVGARPPVDWLNRLVFYWRGRDYRFFTQLARAPAGALDFELSLPSHLQAIHAVGFPSRRHATTRYAKIWHKRFAKLGPNDAVLLLEDLLRLPGKILPIWGVDHYYSPKWDFRMLVHGMLRYWNNHVCPPTSAIIRTPVESIDCL